MRSKSQRSKPVDTRSVVLARNPNYPEKTYPLDGAKYHAMRGAILKVLPRRAPGITIAEASAAVRPHLPDDVFPGGKTAGWWFKAVQLDLEATQQIARQKTTPLRLHRI